MRQVADESDRIRYHNVPGALDPDAPRGRIQGGEQLIRRRHGQRAASCPRAALGHALAFNAIQPLAQRLDLGADHAAVHFKLGFAGAAHPDTATLTLQVAPHARQARGQMLQLRQLDLQLAFVALCAQGEDVQNEGNAVHHA
ncbi:hypothetical protein G6F22_019874 [Rhizopus arrhizus]|nr:hypothetical protein G6F22_019874 [Rhizopus arrhizus]